MSMFCKVVVTALSILVMLSVTDGIAGDQWPVFQGPPKIKLKAADLPLRWSSSEKIAWQVKLVGYGQSSPVAWGGRVFVTSVSGAMKEQCHVCAYNPKTGKKIWQHDLVSATQAKSSNYISKAAPTPVVDGDGVTAFFEGGDFVALTHDGKIRWERNLVKDYGAITSRHGLGSSLEHNHKHVFVWIEREKDSYVLAVSKSTGETVWKDKGLGATSWSSPRLVPVGDSHHLVLSGIGKLAGVDPNSGKRLWEFDDISGNSTPTPVPLGDGRFLIGATTGRGQSGGGNSAASNGVLQIVEADDGKFRADFVWRAKNATSSFGSPIAHRGNAYFVNRSGVVYCLDLKTGVEKYAQRSAGSVWATPIAADDRIYLFGRNGTTMVIKSGTTFERLAENDLWTAEKTATDATGGPAFGGPVLYAAIVVDRSLILRRGDILYSIAHQ